MQAMREFSEAQIQLYAFVIDKYRWGRPPKIELGAGYGEIILQLARRFHQAFSCYLAGELTNSGLNSLRILVWNENIPVVSGHCDFRSLTKDDCISEYPGGVLYVSSALMYVPMLADGIVVFSARCIQLHASILSRFMSFTMSICCMVVLQALRGDERLYSQFIERFT